MNEIIFNLVIHKMINQFIVNFNYNYNISNYLLLEIIK